MEVIWFNLKYVLSLISCSIYNIVHIKQKFQAWFSEGLKTNKEM